MESTGVYWYPVYEILETAFYGDIKLLVTNTRYMRNVPGKKTDIKELARKAGISPVLLQFFIIGYSLFTVVNLSYYETTGFHANDGEMLILRGFRAEFKNRPFINHRHSRWQTIVKNYLSVCNQESIVFIVGYRKN